MFICPPVALLFGYPTIPAIVIGSLLASHTLLGLPTIARLGETHLEPITITIGATVMSDTLSLVVFAICVSTFQTGFSALALSRQIIEIAVFVPLVLFGVSRVGAWVLKKVGDHEDAYFIVMLAIVGVAGSMAGQHQFAAHRRRVSRRLGGQCGGSESTGQREAGVLRQFAVHSDASSLPPGF